MIIELSAANGESIYEIVNKAACAYDGAIPADCYHQPYMPMEELRSEMRCMTFFGWKEDGRITGVMAIQPVLVVTLIRHAYILPEYQGKGIGTKLLAHLESLTKTPRLLVGTWADATWAVEFYKKHGFKSMQGKDELLVKYWNVPPRQIETSVVLGKEINTTNDKYYQ